MKLINIFRDILQQDDGPLVLHEGIWSVKNREMLWEQFGSRFFDGTLDAINKAAIEVLCEEYPQFQLDADNRFMARVQGKKFTYSTQLREGLAETIAMLGCRPEPLINCTTGRPESIATITVRSVLENGDWKRWASLDRLLPTIAEASPNEFLSAVEQALKSNPCPFDGLFDQEGSGIGGGIYISGLLWALEGLAWSEQHFVRVMLILAALADRDPGGNWANRPSSSMTIILLPWLPQTTAPLKKRQAAIETIHKEFPEIAWKLLESLMPRRSTISSKSHIPRWRSFRPSNWKDGVTKGEYIEQVEIYANMFLGYSQSDIRFLPDLANRLDNLPPKAREQFLDFVESDEFINHTTELRTQIWKTLSSTARKHQRFIDADWAFPRKILDRVNKVVAMIEPNDPLELYRYLFVLHDNELYAEKGNWEEQRKHLDQDRQNAIAKIIDSGGFKAVLKFALSTKSQRMVGYTLGWLDQCEYDKNILPDMLVDESDSLVEFADGFIAGRWLKGEWSWANSIDLNSWSTEQTVHFLMLLPFIPITWSKVDAELRGHAHLYWESVGVNPYTHSCDTNRAAKILTEHNRPKAAIRCLTARVEDNKKINSALAIKALLNAIDSDEPTYTTESYQLVDLIMSLQTQEDIDQNEMLTVEWAYLQILDEFSKGSPVFLESQMASDPETFCHVIGLVYRSGKDTDEKMPPTEQERAIAKNAYHLLYGWSTPPGSSRNGTFSDKDFTNWIDQVVVMTTESGHLEIALQQVGQVLIHSAPTDSGLVLRHAVAEIANISDMEELRKGYRIALFNSRGVHTVDPTGKPEIELATRYEEQAEALENASYSRIATTLRELAEQYRREAKQLQNRTHPYD